MRTMVRAGIAAMVVLGVLACDNGPGGGPSKVVSLTIGGAVNVTAFGQTFQLTATSTVHGTKTDVTNTAVWASADPAIATVSAAGLVTSVGFGRCDITATYQSSVATWSFVSMPTVRTFEVVGNRALGGIGETSQLQAMGTLFTGETVDATNYVKWTRFTDSSAFTLTKGLITAVALGWGEISVSIGERGVWVPITVTPPGTYVAWGYVGVGVDPDGDSGGGVSDVQVGDTSSGRSIRSGASGFYTLGALAGTARLTFGHPLYETAELVLTGPSDALGAGVRIHPIYRVTAGGTVQSTIWPDDVKYALGPSGSCVNCRLIRVVSPAPGTLHLNLAWNLKTAALRVLMNGQVYTGTSGGPLAVEVPVDGGEAVLYVEAGAGLGSGVAMTLKTSWTAAQGPGPGSLLQRR